MGRDKAAGASPHFRDALRPSFANTLSLEKQRAQGRPGAQLAPMVRVQQKARGRTTGVADHPAFPAQWF